MAKYKIGITERGDAGIDLSWVEKLDQVDGAVVITKIITDGFRDAVLKNKDKLILHLTVTGYGGTVLEKNVPTMEESFALAKELVDKGFPKEKIVIRVDPTIPTKKGVALARKVITTFLATGFHRFRVSVIDMYPHVIERFQKAGLPSPYPGSRMSPTDDQMDLVDEMFFELADSFEPGVGSMRIECCAEPHLVFPVQCGCISAYDRFFWPSASCLYVLLRENRAADRETSLSQWMLVLLLAMIILTFPCWSGTGGGFFCCFPIIRQTEHTQKGD